jgi:ABC-type transporter Mla subunit MlaD
MSTYLLIGSLSYVDQPMSQDVSGPSVIDLPEGVGDWIAELARKRDVSEEELLSRLLGTSADGPDMDEIHDRLGELQSSLGELEGRVDSLDDAFEANVSDVRERVIQVKREADAKAEADHGHPDLVTDVGDLAADVDALADTVEELDERVEASIGDVTAETEALHKEVDALTEDVTDKLNVLAAAVVEMRDQVRTLLAEREKRTLTAELRRQANRNGVRSAKCENCSNVVQVGLLVEPRCPHCNDSFEKLDPKDGFFGSNVLKTGSPPALEGEIGSTESDLDDIVEE